MNMKSVLVLLMLAGVLSAVIEGPIRTSGDAGEAWSKVKADEMCSNSDVAAVYICLGNTVSVLWKDESKGTTFYEPEGNVVNCPPGTPAEMGAECMQLMMPNYCTTSDNICGDVAPEEFPGAETEGEIIYDGVPAEEEVEETPPAEPEEEQPPAPRDQGIVVVGDTASTGLQQAAPPAEDTLDSLILIVFGLAVVALILLYFVYKRTTRR